jgi:hypothetical protein
LSSSCRYDVSLYYGAAVEGYLYDGTNQIQSGYAQAQQLADGYLHASVNVGDTYTIQNDHFLILSVAYSDGSGGYYYNNPDGFLDGGGDYPSGSSFEPGGGAVYVFDKLYLSGNNNSEHRNSCALHHQHQPEFSRDRKVGNDRGGGRQSG